MKTAKHLITLWEFGEEASPPEKGHGSGPPDMEPTLDVQKLIAQKEGGTDLKPLFGQWPSEETIEEILKARLSHNPKK